MREGGRQPVVIGGAVDGDILLAALRFGRPVFQRRILNKEVAFSGIPYIEDM